MVLTGESVDEILKFNVIIQMKAIEQYFPVVLRIIPCKLVFAFQSVKEILQCWHSNGSY